MKKLILIIFTFGVFFINPANGQEKKSQSSLPKATQWKAMSIKEKQNVVNGMSAKERTVFLQQMKQNIVMSDLNIPSEKEDIFKHLYSEYQSSQRQIREKFVVDKNLNNLSNDEAIQRLNQSFELGQQLLDNRKSYSEKFLQILTPQQVLKLFQTEGKVRDKVLDKKNNK